MKDILGVALAATILTMGAGTAEAATFRYEFDVTDVELGFHDFLRYPMRNGPNGPLPDTDRTERIPDAVGLELIREFHPLAHLLGASGPNVWELNLDEGGPWFFGLHCVSGLLCPFASPPLPWTGLPLDFGHMRPDGSMGGSFGIFDNVNLSND